MFFPLLRAIRFIEDSVMIALVSSMILVAGAQIMLRNLFDTGFGWSDPLLRIMVLWVGLVGAMAATRERRHITIDVLSRFLPARGKQVSGVITDLFSSVVCALLAWHSGSFVIAEFHDGSEAFAGVPAWACEAIMPLGFAVMALRFGLSMIDRLLHPEQLEQQP
ncbi:MAG TPA: TRAP transporter small permease [Gammaproteobacteria bacterium]